MPPHRVYVEPYCGAASVLLQKPRAFGEVINDLDGEVVNLFRVLREPAAAKDLINAIRLTPFARAEFDTAYDRNILDPVERARRLMVRSFMGFSSSASGKGSKTGFRSYAYRSYMTPAADWAGLPAALPAVVQRLRGVTIENRSAIELVQSHSTPETLLYCDPPYVRSTRSSLRWPGEKAYAHEMTDDDHRTMAAALSSSAAMVIVSGYRCDLYDEIFNNWIRCDRAGVIASNTGSATRMESLWLNPAAAQARGQQSLELEVRA
ncbi:DNA methyltransferase [Capsulimonas corticalis]|uniref:DNA methyltransferase n=2 Tax=Capsulimonas corticalis TaxID=2219043 RepID=A0A402D5M3_9BACT|nr:DNA methyltransferase [Capsulimonas corticalis]